MKWHQGYFNSWFLLVHYYTDPANLDPHPDKALEVYLFNDDLGVEHDESAEDGQTNVQMGLTIQQLVKLFN